MLKFSPTEIAMTALQETQWCIHKIQFMNTQDTKNTAMLIIFLRINEAKKVFQ